MVLLLHELYTEELNFLHNVPAICTTLAFSFMNATIAIAAIGFYQDEVKWFAGCVMIISGSVMFGVYVWAKRHASKFLESYWIKRGSKRKDSLEKTVSRAFIL